MTVVKINAITVPHERFDEFADDREVCLVLTRWRSEQDFQSWMQSRDFAAGHSQHRERGLVGTSSELWSFDVLERI